MKLDLPGSLLSKDYVSSPLYVNFVLRLQLYHHAKITHLWTSAERLPVGASVCPPCWAGTSISAAR